MQGYYLHASGLFTKWTIGNMQSAVKGAGGSIIESMIFALAKAPSESLYQARLRNLALVS